MRIGITERRLRLTQPDVPPLAVDNKELILNDEQNMPKYIYKNTVSVDNDGSAQSWTSIPHGLDFTPMAEAYINNASIGSVTSNGSIPLPSWLAASILTPANFDGVHGLVDFQAYIQIVTDATYVHLYNLNASGVAVGPVAVTYYLRQEPAS